MTHLERVQDMTDEQRIRFEDGVMEMFRGTESYQYLKFLIRSEIAMLDSLLDDNRVTRGDTLLNAAAHRRAYKRVLQLIDGHHVKLKEFEERSKLEREIREQEQALGTDMEQRAYAYAPTI